jgi:hypothetical protein
MDVSAALAAPRRRLLTVPAVTGIGYTLSWIAGLSIAAPSPGLTASGPQIVAAVAGHGGAVAAQFTLTEGLPAIGLAVISVALARAARQAGALTAAWFAVVAGLTAAVISLVQVGLGVARATTTAPGTAHLLYTSVSRLDGGKMLALAVLAVAGVATGLLPRWLRYVGVALAAAIIASGAGYLLMRPGLATLAYVSGPLLLLFIAGTGITLGRAGR